MPLLLVYRRYYGRRVALRLLVALWVTMSAAGLLTGAAAAALGLVPTAHAVRGAGGSVSWATVTGPDIAASAALAAAWWVRRRRPTGAGARRAVDPVCGMQVDRRHAPATVTVEGVTQYFCSDGCAERFTADGAATAPTGGDGDACAGTPEVTGSVSRSAGPPAT